MDAASLFNSANTYFVNEEYQEAVKHYTCAIALQDDVADYFVHKAAAHLKLGQMKDALEDAEKALKLSPNHHVALQRKGVSLFYQGEYGAAKQALEMSLQANPNADLPRAIWLRKCDAELSGSSLPLQGITTETSLTGAKISTSAVASSEAREPASTVAAPTAAVPAAPAASTASAASQPTNTSISGRKKVRHEWYQSNTNVFITIFAKNIPRDDCIVNFNEQEVEITVKMPGDEGDEFQLNLDLFSSVVPSGCKVDVSTMKIEVSLQKKDPGVHWGSLEKKITTEVSSDMPSYPTSNKAKRDWGQIDKNIEADLKNEKPEGDEALNKLFKEIYERADEDTRRAMNKSFQTSGGTVLSTNWGEVGHADYEGKDRPTAPEGQEWKDWKDNKKTTK